MASEVARVVNAAREAPEMFPVVEGDFRRILLKRFPYGVFFQLRADELVVAAIFHLHRDPVRLRDRR